MTHNNTPDPRDRRHKAKVRSELEQRGLSVFPLADAITGEDRWSALAVLAAVEDVPLDSLLERFDRDAWTSDEWILFDILACRRPLRQIMFAIGETEETLPDGALSVPEDALVSWARAFLEELERKRAEAERQREERRRRYGAHADEYRWDPDLFSVEENDTVWGIIHALEERDEATLRLTLHDWNIVARLILTGETPGDDARVQEWQDWADRFPPTDVGEPGQTVE